MASDSELRQVLYDFLEDYKAAGMTAKLDAVIRATGVIKSLFALAAAPIPQPAESPIHPDAPTGYGPYLPAPAPEVEPAPRYCYCYSPAESDPCDDWKVGRYCRFDPRRPATTGDGRERP